MTTLVENICDFLGFIASFCHPRPGALDLGRKGTGLALVRFMLQLAAQAYESGLAMARSNTSSANAKHGEIAGVIRQVDAVNRDMTLLAGGTHELVDIPSNCSIVLNGEAVKLRLLQPGDYVRVLYLDQNNVRVAQRIEAGIGRPRAAKT